MLANQIAQPVQRLNVMCANQNTMQMAIVLPVQQTVIHVQRTCVLIVKLGIMLQVINVSNVANIALNVMLILAWNVRGKHTTLKTKVVWLVRVIVFNVQKLSVYHAKKGIILKIKIV